MKFDPSSIPVWLPPYHVPDGFVFSHITKREVLEKMDVVLPRKRYFFFDSYDHEHCGKKMFNFTEYSAKFGIIISVFDLLSTKQPTYAKAFGRVFGHIGRFGGSGLIAATTTCAVANLRGGKNDEFNCILGFASVGLIWGYKFHSTAIGTCVAVVAGIAGFVAKRADMGNWNIMFAGNAFHTKDETGVLGGAYFTDWRLRKKVIDPGRRPLE